MLSSIEMPSRTIRRVKTRIVFVLEPGGSFPPQPRRFILGATLACQLCGETAREVVSPNRVPAGLETTIVFAHILSLFEVLSRGNATVSGIVRGTLAHEGRVDGELAPRRRAG